MMVKAGPAVDAVVDQLSPYLEEGDLLIDLSLIHISEPTRPY